MDEEREKVMRLGFENSDISNTLNDKNNEIERLQKNIESKDARIHKLIAEQSSVSEPKNSKHDHFYIYRLCSKVQLI